MSGALWTVNARTVGQHLVPNAMLGRYNAVSRFFSWGAMPIGTGVMGLLAEQLGMRPAFALFAAFVAVAVVPFRRVVTGPALAAASDEERTALPRKGCSRLPFGPVAQSPAPVSVRAAVAGACRHDWVRPVRLGPQRLPEVPVVPRRPRQGRLFANEGRSDST
ncbi:hypothetical protein ACFU9X_29165 [Streptomyces atratus]|uniref:hypothetical protein n=1 Tax=Streptomyces atratus TaxID=1893 RepID=UPI00369A44C1